jgi:hypothetical protein
LERIESRLERMAVTAEANQSAQGVAVLSAQQLRGVETGARLAGIGGFAPARAADQAVPGQTFSVKILFSGTGQTETITTLLEDKRSPAIDAHQEIDAREDNDRITDAC